MGNVSLAGACGPAQAIGLDLGAAEDGGVDLRLGGVAGQRELRGTAREEHTLELRPAPGTTPPLMASAVPLPPASPADHGDLSVGSNEGAATRAKRKACAYMMKNWRAEIGITSSESWW